MNWSKIFIVVFISTLAFFPSAYSATEFTTSVPLFIDGRYSADVLARPDSDDSKFLVEFGKSIEALAPILPDDIRNRLESSHKNSTSITLSDLKKEGVLAKFDEQSLELSLNISPEKRKTNIIEAVDGKDGYRLQKLKSAPWSGYFNLRGSETFSYYSGSTTSSSQTSKREPFLANGLLVANYKKLALQNEMDFLEHREVPVTRQSTQLVYDVESELLRATAGDLNFQTAGFQMSRSLGGVSLVKETTIEPSRFFGSSRDGQIFLKRQSEVEVKVNGAIIKRVILPAGTHNLKDFPLTPGANNVEFRIKDDLGQIELIQVPMLYDLHLLQVGLHQYGYATGFVSSNSSAGRKTYAVDRGVFSSFHRYGVTNYWTPGANFQIDSSGAMFGLENRLLSSVGYWSLDTAQSNQKNFTDSLGESSAMRLRYESLEYNNNKIASLFVTSGLELRGANFLTPGNVKSINPEKWIYDIGLHNRLTDDISLGTNFRVNNKWHEESIGKVVGVDLNKRWSGGAWQTGLAYNYSTQNNVDHQLILTLNWYGQSGSHTILASHEVSSKTTRIDWSHSPDNRLNSIHASGALQNNPIGPSAELALTHTREKSEFTFQQRSALDTAQNFGSHQSTLRFGTAIAWTDQGIGVTRPIADSFAMIVQSPGPNNLDGVKIAINKSEDGAQAYLENGSPAILPELQSYADMPVEIDVRSLPLGYSLKPEFAVLRPSYHSGVAMILQTAKSVTVTGILKDSKGVPIKLQTGVVKKTHASFFTDELGQYFIEGIQEPMFELVFDSEKYSPLQVQVPEGSIGVVRLPDLVVKEIQ